VRELLAEAEFYQVEGLISLLSDILGGASADGRCGFSPRSWSASSSTLPFSGYLDARHVGSHARGHSRARACVRSSSSTAKRSSGPIGASTVPSTTTRIHTRPTMHTH
jgi:hypothetical protein